MSDETENLEKRLRITVVDKSTVLVDRILAQSRDVDVQPISSYPFYDDGFIQAVKRFDPDLIAIELSLFDHPENFWTILESPFPAAFLPLGFILSLIPRELFAVVERYNHLYAGYAAIERYHQEFPETPIIAISSYYFPDRKGSGKMVDKVRRLGAQDILPRIPYPNADELFKYARRRE